MEGDPPGREEMEGGGVDVLLNVNDSNKCHLSSPIESPPAVNDDLMALSMQNFLQLLMSTSLLTMSKVLMFMWTFLLMLMWSSLSTMSKTLRQLQLLFMGTKSRMLMMTKLSMSRLSRRCQRGGRFTEGARKDD